MATPSAIAYAAMIVATAADLQVAEGLAAESEKPSQGRPAANHLAGLYIRTYAGS